MKRRCGLGGSVRAGEGVLREVREGGAGSVVGRSGGTGARAGGGEEEEARRGSGGCGGGVTGTARPRVSDRELDAESLIKM